MGALLNICNRYNQTPLDLCQRQLKEHLLSKLLKYSFGVRCSIFIFLFLRYGQIVQFKFEPNTIQRRPEMAINTNQEP